MKKVLSIALCVALTLSMFTSFAFATSNRENMIAYTEIDYSTTLALNTPSSGVLNDDDNFVGFDYSSKSTWSGNAFGANIALEGGKEYEISFYAESADGSDANLQMNLFVLRNYLIGDSYKSDLLDYGYGNSAIYKNGTVTTTFTPTGSGTYVYKLLFICYMYTDAVNYTVKVSGADYDVPDESSKTNLVSYTQLDYAHKVIADGAALSGTMFSNSQYVETQEWCGNAFGAYAQLNANRTYEISLTTTYPGEMVAGSQPCIIVLTDGAFAGSGSDFKGDALTAISGVIYDGNSVTHTVRFTPTETSNYRLLAICYFYNTSINFSISVKDVSYSHTVYDNKVDYTEIDYSDKVSAVTSASGNMTAESQSVKTSYWSGNAVGKSVDLQGGHLYDISFTTATPDESQCELQNIVIVLTDGEFVGGGSYFYGDALTSSASGKILYGNTNTSTTKFVPDKNGTYRLLAICYMYTSSVNYEISVTDRGELSVKEFSDIEYEWKTEENCNDYGGIAISPNGEIAIANYSTEMMLDSESDTYAYFLKVFNNDGSVKFKVPIAYSSDATPVFDEDGNVYIAMYDNEGYSYVHAFSNDGEELWTHEFVEDTDGYCDYDCWSPLYIYDDVLIVRYDSAVMGINKDTGDLIWSCEGIDCYHEDPLDGFTVADGKVFVALYEENKIEYGGDILYLDNAVIVIDAKTGEILDYYNSLDDCCGATSSMLVASNGYLYFVCDGEIIVDGETIFAPFYAINIETGEMKTHDIGFYTSESYTIYSKGSEMLLTDNSGNFKYLALSGSEILLNVDIDLTELFIPSSDTVTNAIKIGDTLILKDNLSYAWVDDIIVDDNHNTYLMLELRCMSGEWTSFIAKITVDGDVSILPIKYGYQHNFLIDEDYIYFTGGKDDSIYAVKLGEETSDTDIESDSDVASDSDADSETDSETDDFLKGDINLDGVVDIIDVALARAHIVGNKLLSEDEIKRGDMNDDGVLDIIDVAMMRKFIVSKK